MRHVQVARNLLVVVSLPVSADARKKGGIGLALLMCHSPTASSSSTSSILQVGMLSHFWINGEALLLTGLGLIWLVSPSSA